MTGFLPTLSGTGDYPLRNYQSEALESVETAFAAGKRRVAVVIPTGGGKTVVFAHLIARQPAGTRVLVLAHRSELVDQAAAKIRDICPDRRVGVVRNVENDHTADVVVAMVQTISSAQRLQQITPFDLIIVDEAHHATATTYRTVLDHFTDARAVGVSATLARSDKSSLGDVWEEVAYRIDILDLIEHDPPYLCDVRGVRVHATGMDLRGVKSSAGDYNVADLEQTMSDAGAWAATADAYVKLAPERRGIVFTPTVASAHTVSDLLVERGIVAEAVDGTTPKEDREAILARFQTGQTQVVANCGVLTEGFDNPAISCVAIARPTRSPVLYTQMAGRGLRLFPGKTECLILDLVGATEDNKLCTLADLTGHDVDEVTEGESLREAHQLKKIQTVTFTPYLGELTTEEINLFGQSKVVWPEWNGVRYIDLGKVNGTIYIAPSTQPGTFAVILRNRSTGAEMVANSATSFTAALRHAEKVAKEHGGQLVRRDAAWRDSSRRATDKQLMMLRRFGVANPDPALTTAAASAFISAFVVAGDFSRHPPHSSPSGDPR